MPAKPENQPSGTTPSGTTPSGTPVPNRRDRRGGGSGTPVQHGPRVTDTRGGAPIRRQFAHRRTG